MEHQEVVSPRMPLFDPSRPLEDQLPRTGGPVESEDRSEDRLQNDRLTGAGAEQTTQTTESGNVVDSPEEGRVVNKSACRAELQSVVVQEEQHGETRMVPSSQGTHVGRPPRKGITAWLQ